MVLRCSVVGFFFFKQKTADEMRISDWSSDVCSSDLRAPACWARPRLRKKRPAGRRGPGPGPAPWPAARRRRGGERACGSWLGGFRGGGGLRCRVACIGRRGRGIVAAAAEHVLADRSEEHTSELQSLMRISYAVFCLKKKKKSDTEHKTTTNSYKVE